MIPTHGVSLRGHGLIITNRPSAPSWQALDVEDDELRDGKDCKTRN